MTEPAYIYSTTPSAMKRLSSLLILFLTLITCARAQVITITFEGMLNAAPIPLDSILVMNLTVGGDTMIYFPDNVLVLDGTTGLLEMDSEVPVLRNQPNPFASGTDVLLITKISGQALLTVHDAIGREVAAYAGSLAVGQHRFRFTAATPGVHVLTVLQGAERATHRLVALAGDASGAGLTYAGSSGSGGEAKSDRSLFTWTPGDALRYIGYATDGGIVYSGYIDEVPVATTTRNFELFAGLACPESPAVTDIDGNVYRAVQIGGQCWMAENLRTATYNVGIAIPNVTDSLAWVLLTDGAWCNYNNDFVNDALFGKLYNWYAAANPNICPQGWHVPTDAEWTVLTNYLGGESVAGGKMKAVSPLWSAPNTGATNESGFSGLPGGGRLYYDGYFYYLGFNGYWWSASESGAESAWYRALDYYDAGIYRNTNTKRHGFCLRCVRD